MNKKRILLKTTLVVIFFSLVSCVQSSFDDEQVSISNSSLVNAYAAVKEAQKTLK